MRAAFMTTLDLTYEAIEIEKGPSDNQEQTEKKFIQVVTKIESASAMADTVDEGFLKWVHPELPAAFGKLRECLRLKAKGMRSNDLKLQQTASDLWLEWGSFWAKNDKQIYQKIKVPGS